MDDDQLRAWIALGAELFASNREKYDEVTEAIADVVDVQKVLGAFDRQLVLRACRPCKRYVA
jgi:chorismate-pyruvate lyase